MPDVVIEKLSAETAVAALDDLIAVLQDSVEGGASVGFLPPLERAAAAAYWQPVFDDVRAGKKVLLVARDQGRVIGTAQLEPASKPNAIHRAEVQKLLVHRDARRRGVGRALMLALEDEARALNRSLLVLDTREGDDGERLYRALGYQLAGVIPGYALGIGGTRDGSMFFYKQLDV